MKFWYRADVALIADRHGLDPQLVEAVCLTESSGKTSAYRPEPGFWDRYMKDRPEWDGANPARVSASYGLMQCMFPTAIDFGMARTDPPEYLFVPLIGLEYGCRVLKDRLIWSRDDVDAALAAYNGGKTHDNAPSAHPKRNQVYVNKVRGWLEKVKAGEVAA